MGEEGNDLPPKKERMCTLNCVYGTKVKPGTSFANGSSVDTTGSMLESVFFPIKFGQQEEQEKEC